MKEPIVKFTSKEQLQECLDWWKHKLFLDDWVIHWNYSDFDKEPLNSKYMGNCELDALNKGALITLADYDTLPKDCIMTLCDEKVLVHELLHLKQEYIIAVDGKYESDFLYSSYHTNLEQMAKSLIMVKYDLPFEWFDRDFHRKEEVKDV